MSEQVTCLCPEDPYVFDEHSGWPANYCAGCRCELTVVGGKPVVTRMVPAVASEAVRGTIFWQIVSNLPEKDETPDPSKRDRVYFALQMVGLVVPGTEKLTDEARVLLAALSQSAGLAAVEWLAAAEWLAEWLADQWEGHGCYGCPVGQAACEKQPGSCRDVLLRAALAAVGAEPGPSDKPEEADHARD